MKKPMPPSALPASTADLVHWLSLVALLAGAAVVLLAAIGLVWSGGVRERAAAQRMAELDAAKANASVELAKVRGELAGANERAVRAEALVQAAKKESILPKEPTQAMQAIAPGREISADNAGIFINFVKTVAKGRVVVQAIASNTEATHYAAEVTAMLRSAGYDVDQNFGSVTLLGQPPVGVQMKIRSMEEQPMYAGTLQKGLEFIGIDTTGVLDAAAGDSVIIFVGDKPQ
jgi:hypothetical protein